MSYLELPKPFLCDISLVYEGELTELTPERSHPLIMQHVKADSSISMKSDTDVQNITAGFWRTAGIIQEETPVPCTSRFRT